MFRVSGVRYIGFVIQCICYSGFAIPFQMMWITNPLKLTNGLQIRWNKNSTQLLDSLTPCLPNSSPFSLPLKLILSS